MVEAKNFKFGTSMQNNDQQIKSKLEARDVDRCIVGVLYDISR